MRLEKEGLIHELAPKVTAEIEEAVRTSANEAEFRSKFARTIENFADKVNIPLFVREEYTLATGRADATYNRLIIEYEPPGSLRDRLSHKHTAHAVQQVKDYIEGIAKKERQKINRLVGVAFDGVYYMVIIPSTGLGYTGSC